jgi:hypothetical protein
MKEKLFTTARIRSGLGEWIPREFTPGQCVSVRYLNHTYDGFSSKDQPVYAVCADTEHKPGTVSYLYAAALDNFVI